jgi:2-amino-4-hydroxy-6-hydroxymethyldihydropteridine diphosphokinase
MATVYLALGSNLGDRWVTLATAVRRLRAEPGVQVVAVSRFYETAPVNCPPGSGDFLNAALALETDRSPEDLLRLVLRIERQFGRVRDESNSPRTPTASSTHPISWFRIRACTSGPSCSFRSRKSRPMLSTPRSASRCASC